MRDAAQEPEVRLPLYVKYARSRLDAAAAVSSDPKAIDRGNHTRDRLQDFLDVYDELNDNIDTFEDRKADFRKTLKLVIEADTEFQAKLRAIQSGANTNPDEFQRYEFLLQTSIDTVDSSIKDHRDLLTEQEEEAKNKKKPERKR